MAPPYQPKNLLARVNFPLYTIQVLTSRHIIVGGGGGSSKTGVANGFEILELSHDGHKFFIEDIVRHETGANAVMCSLVYNDNRRIFVLAGQENYCQLYQAVPDLVQESNIEKNADVKHRKNTDLKDANQNCSSLRFCIKPTECVQTDFNGNEPLLRVIRLGPTGNLVATGGTDGTITLWNFPLMQKKQTVKIHSKEIDDLDFGDNVIVSVSKDCTAMLWNYSEGTQTTKLTWQEPNGWKYAHKRCRFGCINDKTRVQNLYMIANCVQNQKKALSYLQMWDIHTNEVIKSFEFHENLSALAVRDDGRFVAVGTMFSGSISIHVAFSLQRIVVVPNAHAMFVTGLQFIPKDNTIVSSISEAALLSISVDNHICLHLVPYRKFISAWLGIVILTVITILTFIFCSYMGI